MESQDRDTIMVINKFDDFTTFSWRNRKLVFKYNIPVEVDFTDEPDMLSQLLQNAQLQVCTKKELVAYRHRKEGTRPTIWKPEVVKETPKAPEPVVKAAPVAPKTSTKPAKTVVPFLEAKKAEALAKK